MTEHGHYDFVRLHYDCLKFVRLSSLSVCLKFVRLSEVCPSVRTWPLRLRTLKQPPGRAWGEGESR